MGLVLTGYIGQVLNPNLFVIDGPAAEDEILVSVVIVNDVTEKWIVAPGLDFALGNDILDGEKNGFNELL